MQYAQNLRGSAVQADQKPGLIVLAAFALFTILALGAISLIDPHDRLHATHEAVPTRPAK